MFRVILFLFVALGASLSFPTSRARILEAGEPVLNPMFTWSTKSEMRKISRELETFERTWSSLPDPEGFLEWLSRKYHAGNGQKDAWGNQYELRVWPDSFAVVSAGIDGQMWTPDDLKASKERVRNRRNRRR